MTVGIAGKLASGKTLAARHLVNRGFHEIDVDALGHRALEDKQAEIVRQWGSGILADDGSVDRRALGALVFGDDEARLTLESIVHPHMRELVADELAAHAEGHSVIHAALLFYMKLDTLCDLAIWVHSPWPLRLVRSSRRDGRSLRATSKRMRAQRALGPQPSSANVDIQVVKNGRSVDEFLTRIDRQIDRRLSGSDPHGMERHYD